MNVLTLVLIFLIDFCSMIYKKKKIDLYGCLIKVLIFVFGYYFAFFKKILVVISLILKKKKFIPLLFIIIIPV